MNMAETIQPAEVSDPRSRRRRLIERATLYGLAGSALIHLLVILIAALVTVRFNFGDAGNEGR
jgi:hypothetical protein